MSASEIIDSVNELMEEGESAVSKVWGIGKDIGNALPTDRSCKAVLKNECTNYNLTDFRVHTESGGCITNFPSIIGPAEVHNAHFAKTPFTARGAVGVFTLDLFDKSTRRAGERIAVMYKVPFDLNRKKNQYAIGVFGISRECNRDLFREMSKTTNPSFTKGNAKGPALTHTTDTVTIRATMSDCYTPTIIVFVSNE